MTTHWWDVQFTVPVEKYQAPTVGQYNGVAVREVEYLSAEELASTPDKWLQIFSREPLLTTAGDEPPEFTPPYSDFHDQTIYNLQSARERDRIWQALVLAAHSS